VLASPGFSKPWVEADFGFPAGHVAQHRAVATASATQTTVPPKGGIDGKVTPGRNEAIFASGLGAGLLWPKIARP